MISYRQLPLINILFKFSLTCNKVVKLTYINIKVYFFMFVCMIFCFQNKALFRTVFPYQI